MEQLHQKYNQHFSEVFHTITTDNGSEFADFSSAERYGSDIYFAEPYSAWERPVNERTNRLLRNFIPKGISKNLPMSRSYRLQSESMQYLANGWDTFLLRSYLKHTLTEFITCNLGKLYSTKVFNLLLQFSIKNCSSY